MRLNMVEVGLLKRISLSTAQRFVEYGALCVHTLIVLIGSSRDDDALAFPPHEFAKPLADICPGICRDSCQMLVKCAKNVVVLKSSADDVTKIAAFRFNMRKGSGCNDENLKELARLNSIVGTNLDGEPTRAVPGFSEQGAKAAIRNDVVIGLNTL